MFMKIIHISIDEKFIDCAIDIFNELTGVDSSYFVYSKKTSLKYIKYKDILLFGSENDLIQKVNEEKCDFVILHSLCLNYKYIARIKHKIIWNSWGYDIYSDVQDFFKKAIPLPFYKPLTRNFLESIDNKSIKKSL